MYHRGENKSNLQKNTNYGYPEHKALQQQAKQNEPKNLFFGVGDMEKAEQRVDLSQPNDPSGGHQMLCSARRR